MANDAQNNFGLKWSSSNPRIEAHMYFICPECGKEHKSMQEWRRHLNEAHDYARKTFTDFNFTEVNDRYHECQICHKWVANAHQTIALLQYHRFLHLPFSRTYRCRHCQGAFTRKRALCDHLHRSHGRLIEKVEKMRKLKLANEAAALKSPKENPEFYMRFLCPQCGKMLHRFQQWQMHIDQAHRSTSTDLKIQRVTTTHGKNHYCTECRKMLNTGEKEKLQRHRFGHLPYDEYFRCAFCAVTKGFKTELLYHFVKTHKREFEEARPHLKLPKEWGSDRDFHFMDELKSLLTKGFIIQNRASEREKNKSRQTDLIQKALQQSAIDLEEEAQLAQPSKSSSEHALDQSLRDLEAILRDDASADTKSLISCPNNADEEFEDLFQEVFEIEVDEVAPTAPNPANTSNILVKDEIEIANNRAESQEQILKIEINQLDEDDDEAMEENYEPQRKQPKLEEVAKTLSEKQLKALVEKFITYLCPQCREEQQDQTAWRIHVFDKHDLANSIDTQFQLLKSEKCYQCLQCLERIPQSTKKSDLQRHQFLHLPFQNYLKCKLCGLAKSSKLKMQTHLKEHHKKELYRQHAINKKDDLLCQNCGKQFHTEKRLNNHVAQCAPQAKPDSAESGYDNGCLKMLEHLMEAQKRIRRIAKEISTKK